MAARKRQIDLRDPRVRRTRRLLQEALIGLVLEKDYRAIRIKDITDRADMAYITFFRHYDSIDDLLLEALEGGLSELQTRIQEVARQAEDCSVEGRMIFEYVQKNAALIRILLDAPGAVQIRKRYLGIVSDTFLATCDPLHWPDQPVPPEILASQLAVSLLNLIEGWLDRGMPYSCEQMGEIYFRLRDGLLAGVGLVRADGQG
jgi:AcrR family transcriptional regulator